MPNDPSSRTVTEGILLPLLREESWPRIGDAVHRRLVDGPVPAGPWLTFGLDLGESVAIVQPSHLGGRSSLPSSITELEQRALQNLADREFKIEKLDGGQVSVSDEYASEAILLPELMGRVQKMLGQQLVVVAMPVAGLFVAANPENHAHALGLVSWSRKRFDESKGRRISPLPLVAQDGKVLGFVSPQT